MTFVKKFGFKNYDGKYRGIIYRVQSLMFFDMSERIFKQKSVIFAYITLIFMLFIFALPILAFLAVARQSWEDFGTMYGSLGFEQFYLSEFPIKTIHIYPLFVNALVTFFMTIIFLGIAGGKVLSQDIETKVIQNYFTRLSRYEYFTGKFLAVYLSYLLSLQFPFTIIYIWICSVIKADAFSIENIDLFLRSFIFTAYTCLFYTSLTLFVSSGTARRFYATLIFIVFLTGVTIVPTIFWNVTGSEQYLIFDVLRDLRAIYLGIAGYNPLDDLSGMAFMLTGYYEFRTDYWDVSPFDALLFTSGLITIFLAYSLKKTALDEE
ncbi:MAG: hypothetical protein ACXAEU_12000 [Candidatus Hodarchaeales archaeon]|jgi:ABC-type transport system involved in multi-copper enzyme maturation permease subunit